MLVWHHHGSDHLRSIWYHSEPSDVLYSLNPFFGWDLFTLALLPKIPFKLTQSIHVALQKSYNFD